MSRNVLLQLLGGKQDPTHLRRLVNLWPPFLGAGIRIKHIAPDMRAIDVEMKPEFLECKLRRHALWRIAVRHDRPVLYAHADGESGS